jgi:trk system potassium uptake protein TrkH
MNLWRGMLNSFGGLGIAFVAMIFLPVLRVGGMQYFKTEGFDTFGKALPRATDIARQLVIVYFGLTLACILAYRLLGMSELSAVVNGMTTVATGGFSDADASFSRFGPPIQYTAAFFMVIASLPYIRYVQLINGQARPLWQDSQIRAYLKWIAVAVGTVTLWRLVSAGGSIEETFREALFNLISIMSSTGFGAGSFSTWGGYMLIVAFLIGIVGACSGSSASGLSVFRVQIAASALSGLILFITSFVLLMGIMTVTLTLMGVDPMSALWGVWTSIGNIGYGMGPLASRTGTLMEYPDAAKWVLILAMIMGRLGLMAIFVLFLPRFWRD